MARTDIHSVKNLNPDDYEYVGAFLFSGVNEYTEDYAEAIYAELSYTLRGSENDCVVGYQAMLRDYSNSIWKEGNFYRKQTCDHCGARFEYGAIMQHMPTKQVIVVGHVCAAKTFTLPDRAAVLDKNARAAKQRVKTRLNNERHYKLVCEADPELAEAFKYAEHSDFIKDVMYSVRTGKHPTSRMRTSVIDAAEKTKKYLARKEKEAQLEYVEAPEGRVEVVGEIIGKREDEDFYSPYGGFVYKVLLRCRAENGKWFKVWCSANAEVYFDHKHGDTVACRVTLKRSDKDATFAIGKRPSNWKTMSMCDEKRAEEADVPYAPSSVEVV